MSDVPIEIVAEILRRLPVKSLVRFRSVSKPWRALIYSSDFVKSHLNQSLHNNTNRILVLGIGTLDSVDFDSLDATAVKLDSPVRSKLNDNWAEILGSCHGLLCLINRQENRIFLWNPSTRRHKKLPAVEIPFGFQYVNYGFAYDRVNDDYKVVRMLQFTGDGDDVIDSEIKVYSSNTNSWRRIQDFPYCFYHKRDNGTLANGALHWVVGRKPESIRNLIAAFDLASEEYHLLPQPDYIENGFHMTVGVIGDCLCVNCNYYPRYFDVWLMNEYGVKGSWIKLLSIAQPYDIRPFSFLKPIAFSKSGVQLLLEMAEGVTSFFWYDLEKKSVKQLEIHGGPKYFTEQYFCIQSLVPLKGGGARDGMTKSQEKKEKRRIRKKIEEAKKLDTTPSKG